MSHRKDNSPNISFFSFQDIITSVTGIMFLVVMILILMLLIRKEVTPEERTRLEENAALKAELERLQEELTASAGSTSTLEKRLRELENLGIEEIPKRLAKLTADLAALEDNSKQYEEKIADAKELLESLKEEQEKSRNLLRLGGEQLKAKNDEEILLAAKVQELEKKLETARKTMKFTWQRKARKKPLLVECGGSKIQIGTAGDNVPIASLEDADPMRLAGKFLTWTTTQNSQEFYFLLLVKPSAFPYAEALSDALRKQGYDRGREILPNDDTMIFQPPQEAKP